MDQRIYSKLIEVSQHRGGGFLLLLDPDRVGIDVCVSLAKSSAESGVDGILVGTSFMLNTNFAEAVKQIKAVSEVPVVIFPGSFAQITPHADALLFTSLISGRNPVYLIEEQVKGAPLVRRCGIEAIPTGYMLIESGPLTSVQFISGTLPIPRNKPDIACAHALAAQYLGMKLVYLEAGSGAEKSVPAEMVRQVTSHVEIPVIVGGGLRSPSACAAQIEAGASFVVVGTGIEKKPDTVYLREMTDAVHSKELAQI